MNQPQPEHRGQPFPELDSASIQRLAEYFNTRPDHDTRFTTASVLHNKINLDLSSNSGKIYFELLNSPWMQRERDVLQLTNVHYVFKDAASNRFSHSVDVGYLAISALEYLKRSASPRVLSSIEEYEVAVVAAALLHDLGHLGPSAHLATKLFFGPNNDHHEKVGVRIIREDQNIQEILRRGGPDVPEKVVKILEESKGIPAWAWQLISGGGWNVDRGSWAIGDSKTCGIEDGIYDVPGLLRSLFIKDGGKFDLRLGISELGDLATEKFAIARRKLYRDVFQHKTTLCVEAMETSLIERLRELRGTDKAPFMDRHMDAALNARSADDLSLETIYRMRDSWWLYHLNCWSDDSDPVISDLSRGVVERNLFKPVRVPKEPELEAALVAAAESALRSRGLDPSYYLRRGQTSEWTAKDMTADKCLVFRDSSGDVKVLAKATKIFRALADEASDPVRRYLFMPHAARETLRLWIQERLI